MEESTALTPEVVSAASATKRAATPDYPTASGLDRAMNCAGSMVLPQVYSAPGKAAVRGSVLHKFIETARTKSRQEALAEIDDDDLRNQAATIDLDSLPVGAESEVALAYNPETGEAKRLTLEEQRGYPNEEGWLYGTADLIGVAEDYVVVCDVKTGVAVVSAYDSWQLRFLATAAAVLAEKRRAKAALLYLNENGNWRQDWAEFTTRDLGAFAAELREMMKRGQAAADDVAAGRIPPLATGPWCRWCKSMPVCAAQTSLVRAMVPTLAEINSAIVNMTAEEAGQAYLKCKAAEGLLEQINAAIANRVEVEPLPLGNGLVLKRTIGSRSAAHPDASAYLLNRYNAQTLAASSTVNIKSLSQQLKADLEGAGLIETKRFPVLRQVRDKAR